MDSHDNIINAPTGLLKVERRIFCYMKYKYLLKHGASLEDFAKAVSNLKNRIKEIEHTEEYQKHLKKTSHNECYRCCGGIVTTEIEKEWEEREKKEHWSEHRRKSFELSTALYFYYRKRAEVEEANKPWWRFW